MEPVMVLIFILMECSRDRGSQFLLPQPALKSGTFSPGLNSGTAVTPAAFAAIWFSCSISCFDHPTLLRSMVPEVETWKTEGTFVIPYAFDTAYFLGSSSRMGNVTPYCCAKASVSDLSFCETPTMDAPLPA